MVKDEATIISPDTRRQNRVPPGQSVTEGWPTLHCGGVPKVDVSQWRFRIFGLVDKERNLDFNEFMGLPMVKVFSDIHCVTTWSRLDNLWEGVSASVLKNLVKINPEAGFAIIHASGGFTTNLSLDDFFQEDVLFVVKHDGKTITLDHGYPVRLVVPRLYFWKSAKWVDGVEFTKEDRPGFWESHGYHNHGDPWTEERYG
ncbi:MAG: sulfite oxidase-like oxidoreductase [Methanotrichaceae archaeon]|jgi:DMSO/TMAO reductase YedYZ molybdopterin-dependent catalytic subunit